MLLLCVLLHRLHGENCSMRDTNSSNSHMKASTVQHLSRAVKLTRSCRHGDDDCGTRANGFLSFHMLNKQYKLYEVQFSVALLALCAVCPQLA